VAGLLLNQAQVLRSAKKLDDAGFESVHVACQHILARASDMLVTLDDALAQRLAASAWLDHLREHVQDAVAAGVDATRRSTKKRVRSRGEARRCIRGAWRTLAGLIAYAERGLPPPPTPR
jgi:hypothetical protein